MNGFADAFVVLLALAFIVQVTVDLIKGWVAQLPLPEGFHKYTAIVVSLLVGGLVAYETDVGILTTFGVNVRDPAADIVLTALMLAGGANVVNQVIEYLRQVRKATTSAQAAVNNASQVDRRG